MCVVLLYLSRGHFGFVAFVVFFLLFFVIYQVHAIRCARHLSERADAPSPDLRTTCKPHKSNRNILVESNVPACSSRAAWANGAVGPFLRVHKPPQNIYSTRPHEENIITHSKCCNDILMVRIMMAWCWEAPSVERVGKCSCGPGHVVGQHHPCRSQEPKKSSLDLNYHGHLTCPRQEDCCNVAALNPALLVMD